MRQSASFAAHTVRLLSIATCFAVSVTVTLSLGVSIDHRNNLFVDGTEEADEIVLVAWIESGPTYGVVVSINAVDYGFFDLEDRAGITVRGYGGDDLIELTTVSEFYFNLSVYSDFAVVVTGDEGDDEIWGSRANDELYGNEGDDYIVGGSGNDVLLGGDGNDILIGSGGSDTIDGNAGDYDKLYGSADRDQLGDPDGVEVASGDTGNDDLKISFRSGWSAPPTRPSLIPRLYGGYDTDYVEVTNLGAPVRLRLNGDYPNGYDNDGDRLIAIGDFADLLIVDQFENETYLD